MPKKWFLFLVTCICCGFYSAQNDTTVEVISPYDSPSLKFTENLGQWQDNVLFRAGLDGGALYLEKNCLTFNFYDKVKYRALHHGGLLKSNYKDLKIQCHAYKIVFEGCLDVSAVDKLQPGTDYENFFLGNNPAKWKGGVKNYHQTWLRNLYHNIDYEVFTAVNGIKYNFHVKPGAKVSDIKLRYEGVNKLQLKDGALIVSLSINGVQEQKPFAYQRINNRIVKVACNYKLNKNVLSFDFPNGYNTNYELVIDPILVFAAQSGSTADNFGMTATYDPQGNLYSGGTAFNTGYPVTPGAYDITFSGPMADGVTDVVITKYNSSGNALLFSTYLGGSSTEIVSSLIVDFSGNLCLYGATGSSNFPAVAGCYDLSFNGGPALSFLFNGTTYSAGTDIYVAKFNSSGTSLLASTFFGGTNNDGINHVNHLTTFNFNGQPETEFAADSLQFNYGDQYRGEIQVDLFNNIYITSSTRSSNFPTVNAFDNTLGGKQDAIVAKFNSSLTQLIFSSYLGGSLNDCGNSLIVNDQFEIYVTGGTCSNDFTTTTGAFSTTYNGGKADGYLTHISASGSVVLQSTYIGTNDYDQSYFVQSDKYNRIYVYGQSLGTFSVYSTGFPSPYNNAGRHQFINRFNRSLSTRNLSTVFGSSTTNIDISPAAFSVDKCNNIYLSGWGGNILGNTPMSGMPLLVPTQSTTTGFDFYFMGLDSSATALKYGSYFGGAISEEHVDGGTSRFDPRGKIYQSVCAGCRTSAVLSANQDFPVTPGAWPLTPGNPNHNTDNFNCNNGVVKLDFQLQLAISTINTNTLAGCVPFTANFINATPPLSSGATFKWYFGNGQTTTVNTNPSVTYTAPGVYTVALVVNDNQTCNKKDSSITYITVYPSPVINLAINNSPCTNVISYNSSVTGNTGSDPYLWNFGNNVTSTLASGNYTYPSNGSYTLSLAVTDVNGCKDTKTLPVSVFNFTPSAVGDTTICYGKSAALKANGGTSYTWYPGTSLNNSLSASPIASPLANTVYTVTINNNSPGYTCSRSFTTQVQVNPTPTTNFNFTVNPCGGGVYFTDFSKDNIASWNWNLAANATRTIQNPYYFYKEGGTYTVSLETTNTFGCKNKTNTVVPVPKPEPVSVNDGVIICKQDRANLSASGGLSYQWSPTVSLDLPASSNPVASPTVSTEYSVIISTGKMVDGKNCDYMLLTNVEVEVLSRIPIKATANPQRVVPGQTSNLDYIGDPGATVKWAPGNSLNTTTGYNVVAKPPIPTTYTVTATKGPCSETVTVFVDAYSDGCLSEDVFIPNTFTPNGDGANDVLFANSYKVNQLYFAVYNRWGEMVFETNDKKVGWDGRYKGRDVDVGVYGWYIKGKCSNGEETFLKGNVTLIR